MHALTRQQQGAAPPAPADHDRRADIPVGSKSIRLLEVDPDLFGFLAPEHERVAARLALPVQSVTDKAVDVGAQLEHANAFGALVLDGMLAHRVRIGDRPALRVLGPTDVLWLGSGPSPIVVADACWSAFTRTSLALLDNSFLVAVRHFPQLVRGLARRVAQQSERDAAHLAASQLPRVDQRLLAIMWLLAEKCGYVSAAGTVLPLVLTHETLGSLIGARRPTVTLALRQLSERDQLVKHDHGWLIVAHPRILRSEHSHGTTPRTGQPHGRLRTVARPMAEPESVEEFKVGSVAGTADPPA